MSTGVDLATVTGFLREKGVAEYKIPLEVVRVDELPRTPAGKLDRRALETLLEQSAVAADAAAQTLSSYDEALALVQAHTATLLGREPQRIAPHANFRSQGINSLLGVRLGNLLAEATGLPLPASLAFDFPTPAAVARLLTGQTSTDAASAMAAGNA